MNDRVGYVLKKVQALLRAHMDEVLEAHGLTTPQYAALSALEQDPGLSNAELARRCYVTPQTMIRIVENLETLGLVGRQPHPTHGRVLQTALTPRGERLIGDCHDSVRQVEARMVGALAQGERRQLLTLLERCAQALE